MKNEDGAYLISPSRNDIENWAQIIVIGPLGNLAEYVAAAEMARADRFVVHCVSPLVCSGATMEATFDAVKRGFVSIILEPALGPSSDAKH